VSNLRAGGALRLHTSRLDMLVRALYCRHFCRPASTTNTTSGMVSDVSAMFVATTILRTPCASRWNTRRWSEAGSAECRGSSTQEPSRKRRMAARRPTTVFTCAHAASAPSTGAATACRGAPRGCPA
jgi:hypothetical protein